MSKSFQFSLGRLLCADVWIAFGVVICMMSQEHSVPIALFVPGLACFGGGIGCFFGRPFLWAFATFTVLCVVVAVVAFLFLVFPPVGV